MTLIILIFGGSSYTGREYLLLLSLPLCDSGLEMGLSDLLSGEERFWLLNGARGGTRRGTPIEDVLFEWLNLFLTMLCHLSKRIVMLPEVRVVGAAVIHSLSLPPFSLSLSFSLLLSCFPYTAKCFWSTGYVPDTLLRTSCILSQLMLMAILEISIIIPPLYN